jgi:hypothetical protein
VPEQIREFSTLGMADFPRPQVGPNAHRRHCRNLLLWMAFSFLLFGKPSAMHAQIGGVGDPICRMPLLYDSIQATNGWPEYEIKAAIIYRCLELAKWPAESSAASPRRLRVGILGKDLFGTSLRLLKGKTIAGRKVVVSSLSSLAQARRCQLVFFSSSETNRTGEVLNGLARLPVLTVGEIPGFTEQGGIINLLLVEKNIRLEVNAAAARQAGIVLHPGLIKLGARAEEPSPIQGPPAPTQAPTTLRQVGA